MSVEICTVGGFSEVGRNMTAIKIDDEVVLLDMGIFLPAIVSFEAEEGHRNLPTQKLIDIGAIPDDHVIESWKPLVKGILLGHAHLDHIAAVPYLAGKYKVPLYATPFSLEILKAILHDDEMKLPNRFVPVQPNTSFTLTPNITVEFIGITHSTLQCSMIALHTPYGVILYACDFKFDNTPVLGDKPNYKRLQELGEKGVHTLIVECLYAHKEMKTPSEKVAKEMLQDVLYGVENKGKAVFVTTFGSHLPRIKTVIESGKKLKRKVVILGRSMGKYIKAAEDLGLVHFSRDVEIATYKSHMKKILNDVEKNRGKYIVLCTGSQGEPGSILDKILSEELPFNFGEEDHVVFSCKTIPAAINIANREALEARLKKRKVRIFTEIHVSGHAGREDLRDFINMTKPKHIIPAHGDASMKEALGSLAEEMNYKIGTNVFLMSDGQKVAF
ncbi:RNase J family beta-CASP ribonuclease [Candidatus Woesearchaeota archaeon]|nr:RNase J family beta-CASP ribonuclease [Candidatus Woesearchaeota archaeon]